MKNQKSLYCRAFGFLQKASTLMPVSKKNKDASTRASRREINHKMFWQITMAQNGRGLPFIF